MNDSECTCGMPRIWTPGFPQPFTYNWHVMHKKVHVATFPEVDWVTLGNLDALIEWAKEDCYV